MAQTKTEQPTERRLRKAREQGQTALSPDLTGSAVLAAGVLLLSTWGPVMWRRSMELMSSVFHRVALSNVPEPAAELEEALRLWWDLMAPLLVAVVVTAVGVSVIQLRGVVFSIRPLLPDLNRISPGRGLAELFSARRFFHLAKVVLVLVSVGAISMGILARHAVDLARLPGVSAQRGLQAVGSMAIRFGTWMVLLSLFVGVGDLVLQRHLFRKRMMMSKEEVRQEQREVEGDPVYRGERQRLHREAAQFDLAAAIRRATVLVVNPNHLAAALYYQADRVDAPELVAKGRGQVALDMKRLAEELGIPVVEDAILARSLHELDIGDQIPVELYEAVAEILKFVYDLEQVETHDSH